VCRAQTMSFDADLRASTSARHWVAALLERWELEAVIDRATLITSELVANSVVHARSDTVVTVTVDEGVVEIAVRDREPTALSAPHAAHPRPPDEVALIAEGGRGLVLVDALADEWGTVPLGDGKQVWARLTSSDWSHRSACQCRREHPDRVTLSSGRYALALAGPWDQFS
jgi:anti-sigma regulatory factor (Ser/Thr protein kinase)